MPEYIKDENGNLVCSFKGRMDAHKSAEIEELLFDTVLKASAHVIFDLKDTEYVSSAFLRICVKTARAAKGRLKIINLSVANMNVFKMTGLDRIFDLESAI